MMTIPKLKYVILLVLMFIPVVKGFAQEKPLRPLLPDDLSRLEEIGQTALSPDGQWLAFVLRRPKATALIHARPFLEGNDRGDVWLISTTGGSPQNLTKGAADHSGWWAPVWSPDSQRLAMLSTRGDNVRLWLWQKSTRRLKQLTERNVDIIPTLQGPVAWIDNRKLVCIVLPEGHKPNALTVEMRAAEIAMREWPKAWRGQETTASALESGIALPPDRRPQGQLLLIDVTKGSRQLAIAPGFRDPRLSPDGAYIAVLKQVDVLRPDPGKPLPHGSQVVYQAAVFDLDGKQVLTDIARVKEVRQGSLRWSPDGKTLALTGRVSSATAQTVTCALSSGTCQPVANDEPAALQLLSNGRVMMLPKPQPKLQPGDRQDWSVIEAGGQQRNLTAKMKAVPRELIREAGGEVFVGIADGDLWRISLDGREAQNLTADFEPRITSVLWPTPGTSEANAASQIILSVRQAAQTDWHHINLQLARRTPMTKPRADAVLAGFSAQQERAILTARDRTGTYLWLMQAPFAKALTVVETDTHLREIAQAEFKKIEYRGLDGSEMKGWVVLPVGYEPGRRYPLVTIVYAGSVFGDNPPGMARTINRASPLNYQLLAARGYAVLFPSMPLKPEGEAGDPYQELTKGVLPAVDKVIELGIADPKRLGIMGQSYGGYSTYGLIAQTNRFQAAVSLAGLSDLVSLYGIFDARFRYDQFAHERLSNMSQAETGQERMGNPPWKDFERYVRNSPLTYVDRIETPLMIVQGDMDFIAMQQGEQIFSALHRQNKRATFVRYWGEGHVLEGPANIRDMWKRIYEWFDSFLRPENVITK